MVLLTGGILLFRYFCQFDAIYNALDAAFPHNKYITLSEVGAIQYKAQYRKVDHLWLKLLLATIAYCNAKFQLVIMIQDAKTVDKTFNSTSAKLVFCFFL